jgi:hypothetical protein
MTATNIPPSTVTPKLSQRHLLNSIQPAPKISNNILESFLTFTFSDAAGNASATVLEKVGRAASKAARLNKDGHLIKDYYDLPQTSALIGAPGHNSFYQTPHFYSFHCSPRRLFLSHLSAQIP